MHTKFYILQITNKENVNILQRCWKYVVNIQKENSKFTRFVYLRLYRIKSVISVWGEGICGVGSQGAQRQPFFFSSAPGDPGKKRWFGLRL